MSRGLWLRGPFSASVPSFAIHDRYIRSKMMQMMKEREQQQWTVASDPRQSPHGPIAGQHGLNVPAVEDGLDQVHVLDRVGTHDGTSQGAADCLKGNQQLHHPC